MSLRAVIFDFNRTLYDPETDMFYPGVFDMLRRFKTAGVKLGLWSRDEKARAETISRDGLRELFDYVLIVRSKSADDIQQLCIILGVEPSETAVVTDPVRSDLTAAKAAGTYVICVRQGKFVSDRPYTLAEQPDDEVSDLAAADRLLRQLC